MYPRWPDERRSKQRRKTKQKTQRAVDVSSHDEEHRGGQPVMAWIISPLSDWKAGVKEAKDWWKPTKDLWLRLTAMLDKHQQFCTMKVVDPQQIGQTY